MHKKTNPNEQGQAIVFLVVGLVVFLGFVALAIDGGMAYSDRRYAQNSSDAASLAGGGEGAMYLENLHVYWENWSCTSQNVLTAMYYAEEKAIERAATNGFQIDRDSSDGNWVDARCGQEVYGPFEDNYIDVFVNISTTTETSFAHLLFPDVLDIRVDSTTRIHARTPWVHGNAIVSLNPAPCVGHQNGGVYYGSGNVEVNGGGIWTNGCLTGNGHPYVIVDDGGIYYGGEFDPGNVIWDPYPPDDPINYQIPPAMYDVGEVNCTGRWVDNNDIPRDGTPLDPGLYCMNEAFVVNAHDTIIGNGVTFVFYEDVTFNGRATIQLSAPHSDPDPAPAIAGVLFYAPRDPINATCPNQTLTINGTADSYFIGLILAPCSDISLIGNGSSDTYMGQIVGWNVLIGGNADTSVTYQSENPEGLDTRIELFR
jgi:hypothetical protein